MSGSRKLTLTVSRHGNAAWRRAAVARLREAHGKLAAEDKAKVQIDN